MTNRGTDKPGISAALVAEFIGTFALVFVVVLVVSMYALQADVARGLTYPFIALAHGFVLFMLIQTVGAVSGGHFNPAVTLSLLSIKRISVTGAVGYIVVQLLGALVAAMLAKAVIPDQAETVKYASTLINSGEITVLGAFVLEALFTFFLVWAIVGTAVNPSGPREWAPMAIAGTLTLGVLLIAPLTGASLNPARSFGPALVANEFGPIGDFLLAYVAGPVVGGLIAAQAYSMLFMKDDRLTPLAPSEPPPL